MLVVYISKRIGISHVYDKENSVVEDMKYFNRGPQPFGETAQGSHHSSYRCQLVRPLHHTPNCTCILLEKKCCAETDAKHDGEMNTPLGQCENLKFARKVEMFFQERTCTYKCTYGGS